MQVQTIATEGLTHQFKVTVPAATVEAAVAERLQIIGKRAKLKGFRAGKVPMKILEQHYGEEARQEALQRLLDTQSQSVLNERSLRAVGRPKVAEITFNQGEPLEYGLTVEVWPTITMPEWSKVHVEKWVAAADDSSIAIALNQLAERFRSPKPSDKKVTEKGDTVSMKFVGKKDGVPFDGGTADDFLLEIGSNRLIPGFEDQLIGHSVGETFSFPITFPDNYPTASLAGVEVEFEITLKAIMEFTNPDINDELAAQAGFDSLEELKGLLRQQLSIQFDQASRTRLKKDLFDQLDKLCDFPLPKGLLDQEFAVLKQQFEAEQAEAGEEKPDEKEIQQLADRRVKLGMLLSEVTRQQGIHLSQDDLRQVLRAEAARYPGQAEKVIGFYQKHPEQLQRLTAPLLEDKAVDYIITQAKVSEKQVSRDELFAEQENASLGDVLLTSAPTTAAIADDSAVDHDVHTCNDPTHNH